MEMEQFSIFDLIEEQEKQSSSSQAPEDPPESPQKPVKLTQEVIENEIRGMFAGHSRDKVLKQYAECKNHVQNGRFLYDIAGIGGHCGPGSPKVDHNAKGLTIAADFGADADKRKFYWTDVSHIVADLIVRGKF